MRSIVTTTVSGRSRVLKAQELPDNYWVNLWSITADQPLGSDDADVSTVFPPKGTGSASWMIVSVPPVEEMKAALSEGVDGVDPDGFHLTGTVDFVVILDGEVTLALDDESILVQPGDVVVQRNTNHAWFNHGDKPIRLLALMMGLPE